jgi:hypothetical protein
MRGASAWHGVWTCSAKVVEYWMISSLKIKLNHSSKFQRNWNVPLVLLERFPFIFGCSKHRYIHCKTMFTCWVSLFCDGFTLGSTGHIVYIKRYLKAKEKNYENSNISPCKTIIFKKSSKRNQNPSRYYYNSVTNLKFQHKPKLHLSENPHTKIDLLLPRSQNPLSLLILYNESKHNGTKNDQEYNTLRTWTNFFDKLYIIKFIGTQRWDTEILPIQ